jgi:hypothetical protein
VPQQAVASLRQAVPATMEIPRLSPLAEIWLGRAKPEAADVPMSRLTDA